MPKNFRTKLAGTVVTLAMVAAPVATFAANQGMLDGGADIGVEYDDTKGNLNDKEAQINQGAADDEATNKPTEGIPTPAVDKDTLNKPAAEGLGPLGGVMPTLDENGYNTNKVPNKVGQATYKKQTSSQKTTTSSSKTVTTSNPKTGDASLIGYAGLSLASIAGLLKKRF